MFHMLIHLQYQIKQKAWLLVTSFQRQVIMSVQCQLHKFLLPRSNSFKDKFTNL